MISASTAYKNAVNADGRSFRVRLYLNGTLLNADIASVKIYRGACGGEPYAGTVFVPYMECELKGVSVNLEGQSIRVQIGVLTDRANDTREYVNAGTYVVSKPEAAGDVTTFTAVGTLGTIGSGTATITATTYSAIISQIQTATGVTITTQGITVSGSPTDSFEDGITWRDALAEVAKALNGFLTETVDGIWVIAAYCSGSTIAIGADRSQEPPQYDEQSYTLASQSVESGVVEMTMGNPLLDPWDILNVTDINGVTHLVPCLQITHELHGGLSTTVDASVDTETQALANIQGPATKNMQYFWVDAEGAHITQIPKDAFLQDVENGGLNLLITSGGSYIRNGRTALAQYTAELTVIGDGAGARMELSADGMLIYNENSERTVAIEGSSEQSQGMLIERFDATNITAVAAEISKVPASGTDIAFVGYFGNVSSRTLVTESFTAGTQETKTQTISGRSVTVGYNGAKRFVLSVPNLLCMIDSIQYAAVRPAPAITFGTRSGGYGGYSATFGAGLIAETANQFVCGQYNDNKQNNAFEIGNGSSDDARSNAFEVDWQGNVSASGTLNLGGTDIIDLIYPVGAIYLSTVATSPATLFGGTWERIQDQFLLAAGQTYSAGATGGSANAVVPYHRHSVSAVSGGITGGSHDHGAGSLVSSKDNILRSATAVGSYQGTITSSSSANYNYVRVAHDGADMARGTVDITGTTGTRTHTHDLPAHNTAYAGTSGNATGANMPPYLVVYVWKRTA